MSGDSSTGRQIDWTKVYELTRDTLRRRGVDVDWWEERQWWWRSSSWFLRLMKAATTDTPLEGAVAQIGQNFDDQTFQLLTNMYRRARTETSEILKLISSADEAASKGEHEEALELYREVGESSPLIAVQIELAGLIARRARLQPIPYMENDFADRRPYPWESARLGTILGTGFLDGPASPHRDELLSMALDLHGRSVLTILKSRMGADEWALDDEVDNWRMYLALDGIRSILIEQSDDESLRHFCAVFLLWNMTEGWYTEDDEDGLAVQDPFFGRFEYSRGYLDAKEKKEAVASAQLVTDPLMHLVSEVRSLKQQPRSELDIHDRLDKFEAKLEDYQKRVLATLPRSRSEIENDLGVELRHMWGQLPASARSSLIRAQLAEDSLQQHVKADFSAACVEYGKFLEALLRHFWSRYEGDRVLPTFSDPNNSPLRAGLKHGAPIDEIINDLVTVKRVRNPAAHEGRTIDRTECERVRRAALKVATAVITWRKV